MRVMVRVTVLLFSMIYMVAETLSQQDKNLATQIEEFMKEAREGGSGLCFLSGKIGELAKKHPDEVYNLLLSYLTDDSPRVREYVLGGLGATRKESAILIAARALSDKNYQVVAEAIRVLTRSGFTIQQLRDAGDELIKGLQNCVRSGDSAYDAALHLGDLGDASSIQILKDAITKAKEEITKWKERGKEIEGGGEPYELEGRIHACVGALAKLGDKEALQNIIWSLNEADVEKLADNIRRIGYLKKKSLIIPYLLPLLQNKKYIAEPTDCISGYRVCDATYDVICDLCKPQLNINYELPENELLDQQIQELLQWLEAHREELEKD